jgi:hypothetical protein
MPKSTIYELVHKVYTTVDEEEEEDNKKKDQDDEEEDDEEEEEAEEGAEGEAQEITVSCLL